MDYILKSNVYWKYVLKFCKDGLILNDYFDSEEIKQLKQFENGSSEVVANHTLLNDLCLKAFERRRKMWKSLMQKNGLKKI